MTHLETQKGMMSYVKLCTQKQTAAMSNLCHKNTFKRRAGHAALTTVVISCIKSGAT